MKRFSYRSSILLSVVGPAIFALVACGGGKKPSVVVDAAQSQSIPPTMELTVLPLPTAQTAAAQTSPVATTTRAAESRTPIGVPPVTLDQKLQSYRDLIESLGVYPGATLLREYTTDDGHLGRMYGTPEDIVPAATSATSYYRGQLKAQGWETLEEHAAISGYAKGSTMVLIIRGDSNPIGSEPGQKTIMTVKPAFVPKFYFAVEAGPRQ